MSPSLLYAEAIEVTLHIVSDRELARLELLRDLASGRVTASAAAELLGLERRQFQSLTKAYADQGAGCDPSDKFATSASVAES